MNDASKLPSRPAAEVDFPIERVEAQHVTRREFAKYLVVVSGGMAAGSGWVAVKDVVHPPARLDRDVRLCALGELAPDSMLPFTHPASGEPAFVVRLADGTLRAFEQKCTHLSCAVFFSAETGRVECPCHEGAFDARTGAVLQGPPPRSLRAFAVAARDGAVWLLAEKAEVRA
jgi:nitrite reductase/ring-hydroxylating ferredoxin subunit